MHVNCANPCVDRVVASGQWPCRGLLGHSFMSIAAVVAAARKLAIDEFRVETGFLCFLCYMFIVAFAKQEIV